MLMLNLGNEQIDLLSRAFVGDLPDLTFYNRRLEAINPASTTSILQQDFFFKKEGRLFYVISNPQFKPIDIGSTYFNSKLAAYSLAAGPAAALYQKTLQHLNIEPATTKDGIKLAFMKGLMELSEEATRQRRTLDQLLKVVEGNLSQLKGIRDEQVTKIWRKQTRRLRLMFGLFGAQFVSMHYFIYFALSWDIMEPVACLLGLLDVNVAIGYALISGKDYSYQTIYDARQQRTRSMAELNIVIEQFQQIHKFLLRKRLLLSDDFEDAIKGVAMGTAPLGLIGLKLSQDQ